jgi:hypothetical protein
MSPRDPPLWTRGVAIGLLLIASWWLLNTEGIRVVIGDSIGALCLGVIAVSILQGMHLPLALWPEGPWRKQFSVSAVVSTAVLVALMILISNVASMDALIGRLDVGTGIVVVIGTVGLGYAAGFVKQRRYVQWYGIALFLGILPFISELIFGSSSTGGAGVPLCYFSVPQDQTVGGPTSGCSIPLLPSLVFLTAIGTASKLVTEEIAFRRLLIGVAPRSGLLSILLSSGTAFCWYLLLSHFGVEERGMIVLGTLGALSAGCIFALSKSLIVSGFYSAVYAAGYLSLTVAKTSAGAPNDVDGTTNAIWITASAVSVALAAVIVRRNGFFGNLKETTSTDVTRN